MSLKLTRVKNAESGLSYVRTLLRPPPGTTLDTFCDAVKSLMDSMPKEMFFGLLWQMKDDGEPEVVSFIIAFAPPSQDYVALWQGHPNDAIQPQLLDLFVLWVESKQRKRVRFECGKDEVCPYFIKFKPYSTIFEYVIQGEVEGTDELPPLKEKNDGTLSSNDAPIAKVA